MSEQYPPQPPQPPYGQQQPPYGAPGQPPYGYGPPVPPGGYAPWGQRAVAWLWDFVYLLPAFLLGVVAMVVLAIGLVMFGEHRDGAGALLAIAGLLLLASMALWTFLVVRNLVLRQGRTGYTWGKSKVGIRVIREVDGQPMGTWPAAARFFLHWAINQVVYLDYLWPLWDEKNQTLTDKILGTVVVNQPEVR